MGARFFFEVEARGGQADVALRRLLELLRGTAEAALADLSQRPPQSDPRPPRLVPAPRPEDER